MKKGIRELNKLLASFS